MRISRPTKWCSSISVLLLLTCVSASGQTFQAEYLMMEAAYPLINRAEIQAEIGMSDGQRKKLASLQKSFKEKHMALKKAKNEFVKERDGLSMAEQAIAIHRLVEFSKENNASVRKLILDILSPPQRVRFQELLFQYHVSRGNYNLGLSLQGKNLEGPELLQLKEADRVREDEVSAKIAQMEFASRRKMIATELGLAPSAIDEMTGELFDFRRRQYQFPVGSIAGKNPPAKLDFGSASGKRSDSQ